MLHSLRCSTGQAGIISMICAGIPTVCALYFLLTYSVTSGTAFTLTCAR
ncbi:hypothetical protein APS_1844 [Acetobacter pasteurianus subsp. pasteurianus LMG 1262 = NBRC 106471]|nr:hypothetical protein APS_1844 [Acetobacter pasteurianus subsp. pasteurianus LMG 1262 = NBRC 106471]